MVSESLITAFVIPETSVSSRYKVEIRLDGKRRKVKSKTCECKAGLHQCKHIAAVIIAVNEESTDSKTSHPQQWKAPSSAAGAKYKKDINFPQECGKVSKYHCLQEFFLQTSSEEEWETVVKQFEDTWNFPNCLGALDGKHVVMQAPRNCGSLYFNYKGSHSIVLMAVADAEYRLLYCNIGCNGRVADGGVFGNSSMASSLEAGTMRLPAASPLPRRELGTPYVFVADDAFALKTYMMKPYPHRNQPALNRVFNYRLSRAPRVVENAFSIMANRFEGFEKAFQPSAKSHKSCECHLHFTQLLTEKDFPLCRFGDQEDSATHNIENGPWREGMPETNLLPIEPSIGHNHSLSAKSVREELRVFCFNR
ncbi:hypothetical protein JTE90_025526 [Oedothorax gibbosus]|uniref:SWIM-type domain-containing protein n=1 Tax=Oedothorax gibbosus TaxID=931172 RepID=A0AAV6TWS0_9ARAC|nr:hypothetical protein JTE90_025526 [Oedothorax gibbosus]